MREGFKLSGLAIVGIVVLLVLGTGGGIFAAYYNNWFSSVTAEQRGQRSVRENTKANGAFRQAAYEEFFALCASAQTKQASVVNLDDELKAGVSETRKEQILASKTALRNSLADVVNEYNTKSNEYTRSEFLDRSLPYPLNTKDEIQCA